MQYILLLTYPCSILAHRLVACQKAERIADVDIKHGTIAVGISEVDSVAVTNVHLIDIRLHGP